MDKAKVNYAVGCTINECVNHCEWEPCCSLEQISVCSCGDAKAVDCTSTECSSFKSKESTPNNTFGAF